MSVKKIGKNEKNENKETANGCPEKRLGKKLKGLFARLCGGSACGGSDNHHFNESVFIGAVVLCCFCFLLFFIEKV